MSAALVGLRAASRRRVSAIKSATIAVINRRTASPIRRPQLQIRMRLAAASWKIGAGQRNCEQVLGSEEAGAQTIVDIVIHVGDIVGERGDLRLRSGMGGKLQIPWKIRDRFGKACAVLRPAPSSGPLCFTNPSSVSQVRLRPSKAA